MKKVNLLLAAVVAASVAAPSFAANVETSGYFRMNANQAKGGKMTKFQPNRVGRLGNENDDYGEFVARAEFAKVNDTTWSFQGQWKLFGDSDQAMSDNSFQNNEAFVSVTGLFDWDKDAELWAGRRYLRQYVAIADWYYSNYSGHGTGINNLQVGPGKVSVFWSRVNRNEGFKYQDSNGDDVEDKNLKKYVDYFNVDYTFGLWDGAELLVKDTYGVVSRQSGEVHLEKEVGNNNRLNIELHVGGSDFWNSTGLEWFHGSNANPYLCAGCGDSKPGAKSANAYRFINQGYVKFNNSFGLEHVVSYAYATGFDKDHYENQYGIEVDPYQIDNDRLMNIVVRPTVALTKMTKLVAELGAYKQVTKTQNADKITEKGQKYTLAYCITPDTNNLLWGPTIKFFVSYIHADKHSDDYGRLPVNGITAFDKAYPEENHNVMFGVQAEGSW